MTSITIIDGHPDPDRQRFGHKLADAYANGARASGHDVRVLAIADLDIPILKNTKVLEDRPPPMLVLDAQEAIRQAEHLVFIYPLWLGTMPALLKAFIEQVIRPDFAFEKGSGRWLKKLLKGRSARIIVTMDMPALAYRWYYQAHSLKSFERNILRFIGIAPIKRTLLGGVGEANEGKRQKWLAKIEALGREGA